MEPARPAASAARTPVAQKDGATLPSYLGALHSTASKLPPGERRASGPEQPRRLTRFRVKRFILPPGPDGKRPRISVVIDTSRSFPARIAMRWAIHRRFGGISAKSLYAYNNVIAWIYDWAAFSPDAIGDLDLYFTEGKTLDAAQVRALIQWIDTRGRPHLAGRIAGGFRLTVSEPEVILPKLTVVQSFLSAALKPAVRKGRPISADAQKRAVEAIKDEIEQVSDSCVIVIRDRKTPGGPLTDDEVMAIRSKIACFDGRIPTEVFSPGTAYRNWLLFECAYATGFRASELAALTRASVPSHGDLIRLRDDREAEWDKYRYEEAGSKTFGRNLPVPEWLLDHLRRYVDEDRECWGRKGRRDVPALWTRADGAPLSVRQIERIFKQIGDAVGIRLTAHRARHRFTDETLEDMDPGTAKELTGHSSERSLKPYTHERGRRRAEATHREAMRKTEANLNRMPLGDL